MTDYKWRDKGGKEMNFKSQICTTREQSERLIDLGLKNETADMKYPGTREYYGGVLTEGVSSLPIIIDTEDDEVTEWDIPAWSLHRLIEMMPMFLAEDKRYHEYWNLNVSPIAVIYRNQDKEDEWIGECMGRGLYNNLIDCIEWLIKEGYFNKDYLEE